MKRTFAVALLLAIAPIAFGQGMNVHKGSGVVTNIDRAGGKVILKHDPIKSLNWPTMTMAFGVKDKAMLDSLAKDKKVHFEFIQQGNQFVITSISPR
jgi:Cu(I)/Ag(I) efflux system periplasmic protein CusF